MAITETSPTEMAVASTAPSTTHASIVPTPQGLAGVLGSGDHKTIGRLYIGFSLLFGVGSLAVWAYFGIDAMATEHQGSAFPALTLGQLGPVFLFLLPLFIGLATAVVPLQVGASTIAFPRAAAAAFWTWLMSSVLFLVSYLPALGGGIGIDHGDKNATSLALLGLGGVTIALLLGVVCVVTTVVALRTPGMTLDRVPMFSWSMVVAGGLWLLTLPVFVGNLALIFIDAKYGAPVKYGVDYNQWGQLSWVFSQPQVFAYAIPALGIVADVVATFARARQPQRGVVLGAIGLFGALGFGAYVQPSFNSGIFHDWPFVLQSMVIVLPVLMFLGGIATALRKGKPKVAGPFVLGLVAVVLLLLAVLAAAPFGITRLGLQDVADVLRANQNLRAGTRATPIYLWGVSGLVIAAAAASAIAGLFYWAPKIAGRKLADGLGTLLGLLMLVAGLLLGLPFILLGVANKVEGLADSANAFYGMSVAGAALAAVVLLIAFVLFVAARAGVISGGDTAAADAWGLGQSLEWACDSPPAPGNFGELAEVTSPQPLLDLAGDEADDTDGGQA
jgi:heme/copper-type cytochrome/quinol oxidase subunit 1